MDDQKIENLLNLSMDATQEEREKSPVLETGYDEEDDTWEVIVRFSGNLEEAVRPSWQVVRLSGGYAIVTLPAEEVGLLAALPQIEYVENQNAFILKWIRDGQLRVSPLFRRQKWDCSGKGYW